MLVIIPVSYTHLDVYKRQLVDGVVVATGYTKISKSYFRNNSGCYGGAVTSLGYTNSSFNRNYTS